ncbi:hypothetical protein ACNQVK_32010 [Mycobacterium sp. 134]|uniref:hypothetical protein n=1 Tax=Mycobacterium sp. 134 TaxID=3400425 RepID=UPI003AAA627D
MSNSIRLSMLLTASAAAIALAPMAQADPGSQTCTTSGATSTVCRSDGNAQVVATPPAVDYQAQYPFFGPYGLLFHH